MSRFSLLRLFLTYLYKALSLNGKIEDCENAGLLIEKEIENKPMLIEKVRVLANKDKTSEKYRKAGNIMYYAYLIEKCISYYKLSLELNPEATSTLYNLGTLYGSRGEKNSKKSIEYLLRAVALDKSLLKAHYNLSVSYYNLGEFAKAKRFAKNINLYSANKKPTVDLLILQGENLQYNLHDNMEAISKYEEVLIKEPNNVITLINISIAFLALRDNCLPNSFDFFEYDRKAREYSDQALTAINASEDDPYKDINQAEVHYNLTNYNEAFESIRKSDQYDSKNEDHVFLKGVINLKLENYDVAIDLLNKAKNISYGRFIIMVELANAYKIMGKLVESSEIVDNILSRSNNNLVIALMLKIEILKEEGEKKLNADDDECLEDFEGALEICLRLLNNPVDGRLSRDLTDNEISSLHYSTGWLNIKKLEFSKNLEDSYLIKQALKHFSQVKKDTLFYRKAALAIQKIKHHKRTKIRESIASKKLLIRSGIILILISTFLMFIGKPNVSLGIRFNQSKLIELIDNQEVSNKVSEEFSNKVFWSEEKALSSIKSTLSLHGLDTLNQTIDHNFLTNTDLISVPLFTHISDALTIFLFTISIAILILGVLFNHFTKFKMFSVEIERNVVNLENTLGQFKIERGD